ncbi:penicillin-binding protein 2 [Desulfovibrio mangrovi]|uniref:penicillin-binding protein 2 n=1 Tax=Desulfovibrio mangrovi TaxID=2976983 RepID=UPI00224833E2|nr:penicillin-binding protein 2 [Desulfovibrio mangrovi]UZP69090.1 penicillin-binding protein 2 [Desulfovibrio mangrovi]
MSMQLDPEGYQPPKLGLLLLQGLVLLLFFCFFLRFWYLQIHKGDEFAKLARENRLRQERVDAPRGLLRARGGELLAENRPAYALGLVREDCKDIASTIAQVSHWTGIPEESLWAKYFKDKPRIKPFQPLLLVPDVPFDLLAQIESNRMLWPGLEIVIRPRRYYLQGPLFAHVLGYVAEANEKELEADSDLALGDAVGKQGLELVLENRLRGDKGLQQLEVDVMGRELNRKMVQEPMAGDSILLSLDFELQRIASEAFEGQAGGLVVMDPDTGKLLALVTQPSFDNNAFAAGLTNKQWNELRDDPFFPLQNRVIQSVYPPGSVWKVLMAGLLLKEGVNPRETEFCNGEFYLGKTLFRCWKKHGHGAVDMARSLIESCDVYYYEMLNRIGVDKMEAFAKANGFGEQTGLGLPHERSGLVPSRDWKRKRFGEPWQRGETVITAIGQGFTLVTPVQVACFLGALMNDGKLMQPSLLADSEPTVRRTIPLNESQRALLLDAMRRTVEEQRGTAKRLQTKGAVIGGKTGTAQVVKLKLKANDERQKVEEMEYWERDHAWMASWGYKGDKRYVVVCMLEHGGHGGSAAGPIVKRVYDHLFSEENQ